MTGMFFIVGMAILLFMYVTLSWQIERGARQDILLLLLAGGWLFMPLWRSRFVLLGIGSTSKRRDRLANDDLPWHSCHQLAEPLTSLEQKIAARTQELTNFNQVVETINHALTMAEILPEILDQVLALTGVESADIRVLSNGVLCLQASRGPSSCVLTKDGQVLTRYCQCSEALLSGQPRMGQPPCLRKKFHASLSVPITVQQQVIGVIHLASSTPHAFNAWHEAILMKVGQHLGPAINKARLYERQSSQRQVAETLLQASQTLSASLDLDQVLTTLLSQLGRVLAVDVGLILLCEEEHLQVAAVRGRAELMMERLLGYRLPISTNRDFWQVIQNKEALTFCEPGRRPPFADGFHPIEEVDWCLVVPLLRGDKLIGLLALEQLDHCYDETKECQIALAFANHAAIAIENARLYSKIKTLNEELEVSVAQRTQQLEQAKEALAEQAQQLRRLLDKTIRIGDSERNRIAQDIHDGLSQLIMGALYETQAAKVCLPPGTARQKLQNAQDILKQVKKSMRRIIYDLHPAALNSLGGVIPALEKYISDYQIYTGIRCTIITSGGQERHISANGSLQQVTVELTKEQERAVYYIVQEALHNVDQHADADQCQVMLTFTPEMLCITIEDNGQGIDPQLTQNGDHLGLVSMRERAQSVGGEFEIHSPLGCGTRISVQIPIAEQSLCFTDEKKKGAQNG